jgi:hypothetical protein
MSGMPDLLLENRTKGQTMINKTLNRKLKV